MTKLMTVNGDMLSWGWPPLAGTLAMVPGFSVALAAAEE
jgi:hypothetical protein